MDPAVADANTTVLDALMQRQADVARSVQKQLATDIAELRGDAEILDLLTASVESNIDTIFGALRHDISLDNIAAPTAALEYARRLAQRGVPMNALVRAYRLGHALVLNVAADEIGAAAFDPRTGLALYERITSMTFGYIDWISQQVVGVYEDERDRWLTNRNSTRAIRVREILAGTDHDVDAITTAIRYPMRRTHLGLILWWPPVTGRDTNRDDGLAELESFLRTIAENVAPQSSPLFVAADQVTGWGWLPLVSPEGVAARIRHVRARTPGAPNIALGRPLPGVDGFRRSHTQALRARGIAMAAGATGVVDADTPGLAAAALLGENLDEAKVFVRDTLGNLATDDASDARLRETLRVFLKHGCSYTAAADELTVHFNTVKYRVGRALQRRGRPLGDDRLDTELALLACQWFGTAVLD